MNLETPITEKIQMNHKTDKPSQARLTSGSSREPPVETKPLWLEGRKNLDQFFLINMFIVSNRVYVCVCLFVSIVGNLNCIEFVSFGRNE